MIFFTAVGVITVALSVLLLVAFVLLWFYYNWYRPVRLVGLRRGTLLTLLAAFGQAEHPVTFGDRTNEYNYRYLYVPFTEGFYYRMTLKGPERVYPIEEKRI